ncbi:MAG TPA: TonB-dependent receptor [Candidatus Latescibacteria bacterium]|nr:TonB-dependent receptor [Candidatus Latescibacterota bacterium]
MYLNKMYLNKCLVVWMVILTQTFFFPICSVEAESTSFSGIVVDGEDGVPVVGAVVDLIAKGQTQDSATTGPEGRFRFGDLTAGTKNVRVSLIGYSTYTESIDLLAGKAHQMEIALAINPIHLLPIEVIGQSPRVHRQIPGTVTKVESEAVDLIRPVGTQELLELVPGVNGYSDDGFANSRLSIGIRGLNPRRSSRVLVLEDGVPIQPALYIYPNMYYNPPSERINEVEVIKGSSAIRYGPHTMGGVINYTTRRPGQAAGTVVELTAGTHGYFSAFTELSNLGGQRVKSDIQLLYKRGNGFRENNGFDQINATYKAHFFLSKDKLLYLKANANYENSNATYTGLTEYSFRTNPNFNPKKHDNFEILRTSLDLIYSSKISTRLTGNTTVYLSFFDRRWWREDDVFVRSSDLNAGNPSAVPYFSPFDLVRIGGGRTNFGILRTFYVGGIEQNYVLDHGTGKIELGARGHWERFIDDKKIGNAPDARDGIYYTGIPDDPDGPPEIIGQSHHYETAALALYARETLELGRLTLSPGLRFEYFGQDRVDRLRGSVLADKVTQVILPGLGLNYQVGRLGFFGGVHRGYTPPSSGTLRITNFGQDVDAGGLDLKAEKSWNLEAGVRSWRPGFKLEATVFWVGIRDLVAAGRGTAFKNLGKVETYGFELGASLLPSRLFRVLPDVNLSYSFLGTEIKSGIVRSGVVAGSADVDLAGNELPYAPRHTLTVGLQKQAGPIKLRADWRYVDEVYTDFENIRQTYNRGDTGPIPSYSIVNTSLEYNMTPQWSTFVTAKNLLDEVYIGSRLHSNAGQPQANLSSGILIGPRRQVNVGIRRGF